MKWIGSQGAVANFSVEAEPGVKYTPTSFGFFAESDADTVVYTFEQHRIYAEPFVERHAVPAVFDGPFGCEVENRRVAAELTGEASNVREVSERTEGNPFRLYVNYSVDKFFVHTSPPGNGDYGVYPKTDRVTGGSNFFGGDYAFLDGCGGFFVGFGDGRRIYGERNDCTPAVFEFEYSSYVVGFREEQEFMSALGGKRGDYGPAQARDVVESQPVGKLAGVQD